MQRVLPLQAIALAACLLVGCSESGTPNPTAPDSTASAHRLAFAAVADTVQVQFTIEIQTGQTVKFTHRRSPVATRTRRTVLDMRFGRYHGRVGRPKPPPDALAQEGARRHHRPSTATVTRGAAHGHRVRQSPGDPSRRLPPSSRPRPTPSRPVRRPSSLIEITRRRPQRRTVLDMRFGRYSRSLPTARDRLGMLRHRNGRRHHHHRGYRHAGHALQLQRLCHPPGGGSERDTFAYWDANGNGDLTCSEAEEQGRRTEASRLQGQPGRNRPDLRVAGTGEVERRRRRRDLLRVQSEHRTATFPFVSPARNANGGQDVSVRFADMDGTARL